MNTVDPASPYTVQVGSAILARTATLDAAIATVAGHFAAQQVTDARLGHSPDWWAAHTQSRTIRHAGRTVARIAPQGDGGHVIERFDGKPAGRSTGRPASCGTARRRPVGMVAPDAVPSP